jgi:hypothetical protein
VTAGRDPVRIELDTLRRMDAIGRWRATVADDDVRRDGVGIDYDDHDWPAV